MTLPDLITVIFTSIGLAMDAFAVSIANGMSSSRKNLLKVSIQSGAFFGFFQFLMPLIGFLAGTVFASYISDFDHIIALIILSFLGIKMIVESVKELKEKKGTVEEKTLLVKVLIFQAIATSIDALAVGITFSLINNSAIETIIDCIIIGAITFIISFIGVFLGKKFGTLFGQKASIAGGVILILIGLKIFLFDIFSL